MKNILIGSVGTSRKILEAMISVGFPVSYVFCLDEKYSENVSEFDLIYPVAKQNGIPYKTFRKINDEENVRIIKELNPDYIFVVGLSQLVKNDIIKAAKIGTIGFHPAPLPRYRGRASNVWQMLLGERESMCTMFFIDEGIDSGDILGQEKYLIGENDYAQDVCKNIDNAAVILTKKVCLEMMNGTINPAKQDETKATYTLKRIPEDGLIDWSLPIKDIHLFIRAISKPYPGAFSMYDGNHKIIIQKADIMKNDMYYGFNGQIANIQNDYFDVVCKDGLLRIKEYENVDKVKLIVGHKFK